jgi:hypothetical protein
MWCYSLSGLSNYPLSFMSRGDAAKLRWFFAGLDQTPSSPLGVLAPEVQLVTFSVTFSPPLANFDAEPCKHPGCTDCLSAGWASSGQACNGSLLTYLFGIICNTRLYNSPGPSLRALLVAPFTGNDTTGVRGYQSNSTV